MQNAVGKMAAVVVLVVAMGGLAQWSWAAEVETVTQQTSGSPALRLREWKSSSFEEKQAFLFGFVTMLELEKEWQGKKPAPISQSLIGSWAMGLNGVSLRSMCVAVDDYAANNSGDMDKQVVEILWFRYVQPKLTPEMMEDAKIAHSRNLKK